MIRERWVYLLERCGYPLFVDADGACAFGLFEEAFADEVVGPITDPGALAYLSGAAT